MHSCPTWILNIFLKIGATLLILFLYGSTHCSGQLSQDAYIWQKIWIPALQHSIKTSNPYIHGWHFLAGEREPDSTILYPNTLPQLLSDTSHPLIAVFRFDRTRPLPSATEIITLITLSPAYRAGITHIELDLDWPTQKLASYVTLLATLRQSLPPNIHFLITVLPDWLTSPYFPHLSHHADLLILQVHAVDDSRVGLFNETLAMKHIQLMSRLSQHPFLVALPTYGLRVGKTIDGHITFVEGENHLWTGNKAEELSTDPRATMQLLQTLEKNIPRGLKGVIWFRLPTSEDHRNWSLSTWLAVLKRSSLHSEIIIKETADQKDKNLFNLVITNIGEIDAPSPIWISLRCKTADGFSPYQLNIDPKGNYGLRISNNTLLLKAGQQKTIGWMRCPSS